MLAIQQLSSNTIASSYLGQEESKPKPLWQELLIFLPVVLIPLGLWLSDRSLEKRVLSR